MRLTDLEPELQRIQEPGKLYLDVATLAEAQGLHFLCPKCRSHSIGVWFAGRGVPDSELPGPGRWHVSGAGTEDLTLSPSIHITSGCAWHGFVKGGEIISV